MVDFYFPSAVIFIVIVALLVAYFVGDKKRIGFGWSFFFLTYMLIPGLIVVLLSPSKSKLPSPSDKNKYDVILGVLFGLISVGALYRAFTTPEYMQYSSGDLTINNVFLSVYFGVAAYYMFNRQNRHRKVYDSIHLEECVKRTEEETERA